MRRPWAGLLIAGVAIFLAAIAAPTAPAVLDEQPVYATTLNELIPAAEWSADGTESYLSYSRNSAAKPNHYNAYLRTTQDGTSTRRKLNAAGTGWGGGIDPPLVVYQQVVNGQSDIKVYDIETRVRTNPPTGVNTSQWEWHPTVSGEWILVARRKFSAPKSDQIVLVNTATLETRILASSTHIGLAAGQVNGNWAVFDRCITLCNVFVYDIAAETTTRLERPSPDGDDPEHQYSPSVAPDGTVYLIRSVDSCQDGASIVRYGAGDPSTGTTVATVARGRYVSTTFARANPDGSTDVVYDRFRCRNDRGDLYKIVDP